jgi:hypothetical protein
MHVVALIRKQIRSLSLYVGVAVCRVPKDCSWGRLLFGEALCFGVCLGVGYGFFSTWSAWLYVGAAAVWMWRYVSNGLP